MAGKKPFQLISKAKCARRSGLNTAQQQAYDLVAEAMARREKSVTIKGRFTDDMTEIFTAVLHDQPFLFDVIRTEVNGSRTLMSTTIRWEFRLSDAEAERYRVQINEELKRILRKLPDTKDLLKMELAIHDLMLGFGIRKPESGKGEWWTHTIIGPLLYKETVCEGAAQLFYLLCLLKGVPCQMVVGQGNGRLEGSGPHAWNMVRLGSQFAHVDAFWDMCMTSPGDSPRYDYFNLQDKQISLDHTWDKTRFPVCVAERFSWFVRNDMEIDSVDDLRALMIRCRQQGVTKTSARFRRAAAQDAVAEAMQDACQNIYRQKMQWNYNDKQRVLHWEVLA